jgi:hypothetical protein
MTDENEGNYEAIEDAAWRGKKRSERRTLVPQQPYQKFDIRGFVPDVKRLGMGLAVGLVGLGGLAFCAFVVQPEWNNLMAATTCVGDCGISKITVFAVGVITGIGGLLSLVAGAFHVIGGFGFINENEIQVEARKAR